MFTDSGQRLKTRATYELALGDLDGDGDLDAFCAHLAAPNTVWLNDGLGYFADSGQALGAGNGRGMSLGDLDADGDLDAFVVTTGDQPDRVFLNDGAGVFTDSGQSLGSWDGRGGDLGDLDGDGDLDAFVANYNQPDKVLVNQTTGAGITVTSTSQPITSESGLAFEFSVVLNLQPTADVTVGVSSSDTSEGNVSLARLVFTPVKWSTPQTVTVTGVDDDLGDGDIAYTIVTAAAASSDPYYNGLNPADVSVTNIDDDAVTWVWSDPAPLNTNAGSDSGDDSRPQVSTDGAGNWVAVWYSNDDLSGTIGTDRDILVARSTDAGVTWTTPLALNTNAGSDSGNDYYPQVTTDGVGNWVAVWYSNDDLGGTIGTDGDILVSRSIDNGTTWTAPVALNTNAGSDSGNDYYPQVTTDRGGNWVAVWDSSDSLAGAIGTDRDILVARSADAGATWTAPMPLNINAGSDSGDDWYPQVTTDGVGNWVAVWDSSDSLGGAIGTDRDILVARSTDAGATWTAPMPLNVNAGSDSGDDWYPQITADGAGRWIAVWDSSDSLGGAIGTDRDILVACSTDAGATWTAPMPLNVNAGSDSGDDLYPQITAGGAGDWVAVWSSNGDLGGTIGTDGDILVSRSIDNGTMWTAPVALNTNAGLDSGDDLYPQITTDGAGDWVAVWQSGDTLGGTIDTDSDILFATFPVTNLVTPGITVAPTSGLVTTEAGGTASFTVVLNTQPTADVTIGLASSDASEGTVAPTSLTFTAANWNVAQTVTISGQNDAIADGDIAYTIITAAAVSTDTKYNGLNLADVSVTNTDNDTAGITVNPTSGLTTTEAGGTATFTVVLNSEPAGEVTIGLATSDASEGTVTPTSLTFTAANWNVAQTVTISGQNDAIADGDIAYTIITAAATSSDPKYSGVNPADVSVTNTDNDTAGITVNPTSGLTTTEAGGMASFTVVLNTQPTADVTIGLATSEASEGTVAPTSLTFTAANWNVAQTVTISGQNDAIADGDIAYTIITAAAVSTDTKYNGLNPADVSVTNTDNDTAGITVNPTSGLTTTEAGGTATFTVVLNSEPAGEVTIGLSSSEASEGTVAPTSLTFTAANWNVAQTVTISGQNDAIADGDIAYTIITAAAVSTDTKYNGLNPADVSVTNTDNDTAGITVNPTSGLTTTEAGGTATFTVVLNSEPAGAVTIGLATSDASEGTVAPTSLTFTAANWNVAQTVTISGQNDAIADGDIAYTIITAAAVSTDTKYNGLNPADVSVTNTDNDTAGITVNPTSGLTTTEAGGTASFTVVLNTQPTADVTIDLSSSDASEGTVAPTSLTFTAANWNVAQTVTISGQNDAIADGDIAYTIITAAAVSTDTKYNGLNPADVSVANTDNDTAGITVNPTSGLTTTEAGGTATFTVVLNTQPAGEVTIGLSSSDASEGTVAPTSLTFTAANWNVAQAVTISGQNDAIADGDIAYTIITAAAVSTDTKYNGLNPADVSVANTDNDTAGITVNPTSGLTTTEAGGTASFTVVLNTQPTADVTIGLASSDASEGTVSPTSLTFTAANWNVAQTVTISGQNDAIADGDIAYTIITAAATSSDPKYSGVNPADVSVTNTDNDTAGITVNPTSGLTTTEAGVTASFTVVLNTQPTADVTIGLASSDASEGTVSPTSLTFTAANWNVAQTVTISGQNDAIADGDIAYTIITAAAVSTDTKYNGLNPADVSVTNTDNDTAGITVNPTSGLTTTEAGGTATFTVVLNTQPAGEVTIDLSTSDASEGTVTPTSLTFTAANWNVAQTVTVSGQNDAIADGDIAYTIITAAAVSTDTKYNGLNPADVSVANTDNDTAGITVNPTSGLTTTEAGGTATFTVVLNSEPAGEVTIGLATSDASEGTVTPTSLTFTAANWNVAQTVTVSGQNDAIADGDIAYTIITAAATSSDPKYSGVNPADVSVANTDNDTAGITVNPTSGLTTTEAGGTATFTVVLNSEPAGEVTIGLATSDASEGTVTPTSLTFTAANWNVAQTVTVSGQNDAIADGDIAYTIITAAATSSDPKYSGVNPADVSVANTDNDTAGITVNPTSGLTTTEAGGTASFTVVLNTQPTADVTIGLATSDASEGTVAPTSLTFTAANWNVAQTVTISGQNDAIADGDIAYTIITAAAVSTDTKYNGLNPVDVSVANTDNDTAGITVNPTSGLTTTEAGGTATFTVVLNSEPTGAVTIGLATSDASEGTVTPTSLTFTAGNWNVAQTVTISGQNDAIADGDIAYTIITAAAVSTDTKYNGLNPADVSVANTDNDTAGITVNPTSGLTTTEAGGMASFTVVLNTQPTADVTIGLATSDASEGTVTPTSLTFTAGNWNVAQTVTISGQNDAIADGDIAYTIITAAAVSTDTKYNGLNPADVSVANTDNDTAGITVNPTSGLTTTEAGGTATFTVVLNSEPAGEVTIGLATSDASEGTVTPTSLTFTAGNWNVAQTVTISGQNDAVADGDIAYTIITAAAVSTDTKYNGLNPVDVSVANTDNDTAGITVNPTSGLTTTEAGGTASFTVVLNTQPTADVTIDLSTSDASEGTVTPTSLTFTAANWNVAQTVTISGQNDAIADGDIAYTIITAAAVSTDTKYNGLNPADVSVANTDNDTAGITVNPTSGLTTTEAGGTATFTVVLNSEPAGEVTIGLSSSEASEGTVAPTSLTFTAANWNVAQTVTISGQNDAIADGDIAYTIITAAATSSDPKYSGVNPADVSVANTDNDTAGITVNPTSGLTTTEAGGTASFTVVLNTQPTADVTIGLATSDASEGTVAPTSLTFTAANWNVAQTVTISGQNDAIADGDIAYTIITAAAVSTDTKYNGLNPVDVSVANTDNDTAGITVNPTSGLTTTEAGGTATFTVVLNSEPTGAVTIGLATSDASEGTVTPTSLTFTAGNWNVAQTVTISGQNDAIADGDIAYTIITAAAVSTDTKYNGLNPADVSVANTDNDTAGITVNPTSGLTTTEAGGMASFTVVLNTQPTADVTIGLATSDASEGTVTPTSLTFTAGNWNVAQTVTISGQNDAIADGDIAYTIITAAAVSTDTKYNGLNPADVSVTNTDDDLIPTITLTVNPSIIAENDGLAMFMAVLSHATTQPVTIDLNFTGTATLSADYTRTDTQIVIAAGSLAGAVSVTAIDDAIFEGDETILVEIAAVTRAEEAAPQQATATIMDDDTVTRFDGTDKSDQMIIDLTGLRGTVIVDAKGKNDYVEIVGTPAERVHLIVYAGDGNDTVMIGASNLQYEVYLDDGNDSLAVDLAATNVSGIAYGGPGNDRLQGSLGDDEFHGGDGNDVLEGRGGNDILLGEEGHDTVLIHGTDADERLSMSFGRALLHGPAYSVEAGSAEEITVDGKRGYDIVERLEDSAGDDWVVMRLGETVISGADFVNTAIGFEEVYAYSSAGKDTASMYDTAEADTFKSNGEGDWAWMRGDGYFHRAKGFDYAHGYSTAGADQAYLYDSARDDQFKAYTDDARDMEYAKMYGPGYYHRAKGFPAVYAFASQGRDDLARFFSSPLYTEQFIGTPDQSRLYRTGAGADYDLTARSFDAVLARSSRGEDDLALFFDDPGTTNGQVFRGLEGKGELFGKTAGGSDFQVIARNFTAIKATETRGTGHIARLVDTPGDDHLVIDGALASMYRYFDPPKGSGKGQRGMELLYQAIASDQIEVYRQQNQKDSADTRHVRAVDIALRYEDPTGWSDI
jgi:uncharacterized protein YjiK